MRGLEDRETLSPAPFVRKAGADSKGRLDVLLSAPLQEAVDDPQRPFNQLAVLQVLRVDQLTARI